MGRRGRERVQTSFTWLRTAKLTYGMFTTQREE